MSNGTDADMSGRTSHAIVEELRENFNSGITMDIEFRRSQLRALRTMIEEQEARLTSAIYADYQKPAQEFYISEILTVMNEAEDMLRNLDSYVADERMPKSQATILDSTYVQQSPLGVALIVSSWNFPVTLLLIPAIGAIAAGNCVLLKPSELAPETAKALKGVIGTYMDQRCCRVFLGGADEMTELLKERFDLVFFTGSTAVGKIVYQAAAKNLTPCVLELGGKNPCFLDNSVDMHIAALRILYGKILNCGQACVAPDYILCTKMVKERFLQAAKKVLRQWYPDGAKSCPDYGRIVNDRHFQRIMNLLKTSKGRVAVGGDSDAALKFIEPTILDEVSLDDSLMQEEIFGPVLPIVEVDSTAEALQIINAREKPLTLYVFSTNREVVDLFKRKTSSGCLVVNETSIHFVLESLPFGGVGNSGFGKAHGKASFDTFVNKRAVLHKTFNPIVEKCAGFKYPPSSGMKRHWSRALMVKKSIPMPSKLMVAAVAATSFLVYQYFQFRELQYESD